VKFPTGGMSQDEPASAYLGRVKLIRNQEPEPTVKVRMQENTTKATCAFGCLRLGFL